jgi:hypothetical protein
VADISAYYAVAAAAGQATKCCHLSDDGGQSIRNGHFGRDFGSHCAAGAWLEHGTCDILRRQRRRRHSRSDTILLLLLLPHSLQVTSSSEVSAVQEIISDVLSSAMLS